MDTKSATLVSVLIVCTLLYGTFWIWTVRRRRRAGAHGADEPVIPTRLHVGISFVTNFFDTLGIGSYATTTALFRAWRLVPDEQLPGTLNVGQTLATVIQAVIYIQIVQVEFWTLLLMIAAASTGAWFGAGIVAGLSRRRVQIGMGSALLAASAVMLCQVTGLMPGGGTAVALHGLKLTAAVSGNLLLGALMTLGIGLYAPCMILISLLGMSPVVAFPIMMGSCAFVVLACSPRFIRKNSYNLRAAIGLTLGGPPAVFIAAFIVRALPLFYLRWLVVFVVVYTSVMMLRAAAAERRALHAPEALTNPA